MQTTGIMGAMPEEIEAILPFLKNRKQRSIGGRIYHSGEFNGRNLVLAFSRWGKVAAASTVTTMLHTFPITELLFTGVAGGLSDELKTGDLVIAERLVQHDLDARPLMERHEIPLLQKTWIDTDPVWRSRLKEAASMALLADSLHSSIPREDLALFGIENPSLYLGEIASGDQFIHTTEKKNELRAALPGVLCIEMEGAAVAQVCFEHQLPFAVIRTISDSADESSPIDFPLFIQKIASLYSLAIVERLFPSPD